MGMDFPLFLGPSWHNMTAGVEVFATTEGSTKWKYKFKYEAKQYGIVSHISNKWCSSEIIHQHHVTKILTSKIISIHLLSNNDMLINIS